MARRRDSLACSSPTSPPTRGNFGCLENYAGPTAVIRQAMQTSDLGRRLELDPHDVDVMTNFGRIATAAGAGDPTATDLIVRSARHLGTGAVT